MTVPGQNNLALAMRLIKPQTVQLYRPAGATTRADGVQMPSFEPPITIAVASVQPTLARRYEQLGLDRAKRHIDIWATTDAYTVARDRAADQFEWNGERYEVVQDTGWFPQDGWTVVTAVQVAARARH